MEETEVVEHFFGVYLLYCKNPKYKGRTYIGYTVDPKRRIKQHNAGAKFGGAYRTSNRGPWDMVLIVHGFPNSTSALRFEWAWQHPDISRRLRHVPKKKSTQKKFDYCLMILSEMLKVGPWCRLPLTLRWLDDAFGENYSHCVDPPIHMPITFGKVTSKKHKSKAKNKNVEKQTEDSPIDCFLLCSICDLSVTNEEKIVCIKPGCLLLCHLICLAKHFAKEGMILPVEGVCPACNTNVLWGDLIRKKIGCYLHLSEDQEKARDSDSSDD